MSFETGLFWATSMVLVWQLARMAYQKTWLPQAMVPPVEDRKDILESRQVRVRTLSRLSELPNQFSEWLDQYRQHIDPWPAFEHYIRKVLKNVCGAEDVRAYRVLDESNLMLPLIEASPNMMADCLQVGEGVAGWVIQNRRPYYSFVRYDDSDLPPLLKKSSVPIEWCFPIIRGSYVVGVVTIGTVQTRTRTDLTLLKLVSGLISEQWGCLAEIFRARVAVVTDPATGVLNRTELFRQAPLLIEKSQRLSRCVTAATFSIEGLRRLDDLGYWGLRDQALASVGKILRSRVTPEDCVGRFDDSRFVVVWQSDNPDRVKAEVRDIVSDLEREFQDKSRWQADLSIRCGYSNGRKDRHDFHSLVSESLLESTQGTDSAGLMVE